MHGFLRWGAAIGGALILVILVLVGAVEALGRRTWSDVPVPPLDVRDDPALVTRGEYLVNSVAHCPACHLPRPEATTFNPLSRPDLKGGHVWELPFGRIVSANITPSRTFGIGAWSDGEIARVLRSGVRRDGRLSVFMQAGVGALAEDDVGAIIAYLRAQPAIDEPVPEGRVTFLGRVLAAFALRPRREGALAEAPRMEASVERGGYLARGPANCVGCHSPSGIGSGFLPTAPLLAGGLPAPDETDPTMEIVAPNLTPDETGVATYWSEEDFAARFRGGRVVAGSPMPWEAFAAMTDTDLAAIWRYLRTIEPVRNNVGPTHRPAGSFPPTP